MRRPILATAVVAGLAFSVILTFMRPQAFAHCQVPCGIYDDHARVVLMLEDATTVGKAVDQIKALEAEDDVQATNQTARWITAKDEHATRIQRTIADYFMTQRIKPKSPDSSEWNDYAKRLAEHHAVMVAAMKTKQSVDPQAVQTLRAAIQRIAPYYPPPPHTH